MVYDYYDEKKKRSIKGKIAAAIIAAAVVILIIAAGAIYLRIIQLDEIGGFSSIYVTNLLYKAATFAAGFVLIFTCLYITTGFIKKNMDAYFQKQEIPRKRLPNLPLSAVFALLGALICKDIFYQKILYFMNGTDFNIKDPVFSLDVGYYIFSRPFYTTLLGFLAALMIFIIAYTAVYYFAALSSEGTFSLRGFNVKSVIKHNLFNLALFFIIKAVSYPFMKQDILYANVVGTKGAGFVDVNIWLKYYDAAPFLVIAVTVLAIFFLVKGRLKQAAVSIAVFPAVWLLVTIIANFYQGVIVSPNELTYESKYLANNISETRKAYSLDKIKTHSFPAVGELTPDTISRNSDTKDNIRIVDIQSTLQTDIQRQSNTAFYTFKDGDIINYTVGGKDIPVFITAREIDKNKLPDQTYLNTTYRYTHGYGLVINPINRLTKQGQADFIMGGLDSASIDPTLKITRPEIYYGELTKDQAIVGASGLDEIDFDGSKSTSYKNESNSGIKLNFLNKLLFSIKYGDFNMLISGYSSDATLLLNRQIIDRAQMALPFLTIDQDPYIVPTADGRLKWVIDAYTTSDRFPYAQNYGDVNYIRNSVKIVIDAYDGKAKAYVIDKTDPIIKTYEKIYPGILSEDAMPKDIQQHMRYPELLFKIQTEMMNKYHILPEKVSSFYSQQDLWKIARYSPEKNTENATEIDPYYNMIKLPDNIGNKEELILMRPFTPAGDQKDNMVSWLAVRNSFDNYGEMILFTFPKDKSILGPNQVEGKINQIDEVSTDMTLWGQSGSDVYKGNLLVIPIENSILYVEPIYIKTSGASSIPEVRKVIVGYQSGDDFKFGLGTTLDNALNNLFTGQPSKPQAGTAAPGTTTPNNAAPGATAPSTTEPNTTAPGTTAPGTTAPNTTAPQGNTSVDRQKIDDIIKKYEDLRKQMDELGNMINGLK